MRCQLSAKIAGQIYHETPLPESDRMEGNSSLYPRVPDWKGGNNFRYAELFSDEFTQRIKKSGKRFVYTGGIINTNRNAARANTRERETHGQQNDDLLASVVPFESEQRHSHLLVTSVRPKL